jgi:cephalosporin hydroxylase
LPPRRAAGAAGRATDIPTFQQIIAETRPELIVRPGLRWRQRAAFASVQEMMGIAAGDRGRHRPSMVNDRVREHPRIELIEGSRPTPRS